MIDKHWCRWDEHDCEAAYEEIERLRAALKPLAEWAIDVTAKPTLADCDRARRALEQKP